MLGNAKMVQKAQFDQCLRASGAMADSPQSMRAFLAHLDRCGELLTVEAPVDADFDVAACLVEARDGPALCFRQPVRDGAVYDAPIVGNLVNALPRFAAALDCAQHEIQTRLIAAIEHPLQHNVLDAAPCQETVIERPDIDGDAAALERVQRGARGAGGSGAAGAVEESIDADAVTA